MRRLLKAKQRRARLRIGSLVIVLITVAALAAPVALADKWGTARTSDSGATLRPDDRSGVRSSGPILVAAAVALRPDDRSGVRGGGPILVAAPVAPVVTVQTQTENRFQWGDAGIGGGVILVAMILAGSILLVARHRTARPSAI
jgi:hypothetical protein